MTLCCRTISLFIYERKMAFAFDLTKKWWLYVGFNAFDMLDVNFCLLCLCFRVHPNSSISDALCTLCCGHQSAQCVFICQLITCDLSSINSLIQVTCALRFHLEIMHYYICLFYLFQIYQNAFNAFTKMFWLSYSHLQSDSFATVPHFIPPLHTTAFWTSIETLIRFIILQGKH